MQNTKKNVRWKQHLLKRFNFIARRSLKASKKLPNFIARSYRQCLLLAVGVNGDVLQRHYELVPFYTILGFIVFLVASMSSAGGWFTGYYVSAGNSVIAWAFASFAGLFVFSLDRMFVSERKKQYYSEQDVYSQVPPNGVAPKEFYRNLRRYVRRHNRNLFWGNIGRLCLRLFLGGIISTFLSTSLLLYVFQDSTKDFLLQNIQREEAVISMQKEGANQYLWRVGEVGKTLRKDEAVQEQVNEYDRELERLKQERIGIRNGLPSVFSYSRQLDAMFLGAFTELDDDAKIEPSQFSESGRLIKSLTTSQIQGHRHFSITPDGVKHLIVWLFIFSLDSAPIIFKTLFASCDSYDNWFHDMQGERIKRSANEVSSELNSESLILNDKQADVLAKYAINEQKRKFNRMRCEAVYNEDFLKELVENDKNIERGKVSGSFVSADLSNQDPLNPRHSQHDDKSKTQDPSQQNSRFQDVTSAPSSFDNFLDRQKANAPDVNFGI